MSIKRKIISLETEKNDTSSNKLTKIEETKLEQQALEEKKLKVTKIEEQTLEETKLEEQKLKATKIEEQTLEKTKLEEQKLKDLELEKTLINPNITNEIIWFHYEKCCNFTIIVTNNKKCMTFKLSKAHLIESCGDWFKTIILDTDTNNTKNKNNNNNNNQNTDQHTIVLNSTGYDELLCSPNIILTYLLMCYKKFSIGKIVENCPTFRLPKISAIFEFPNFLQLLKNYQNINDINNGNNQNNENNKDDDNKKEVVIKSVDTTIHFINWYVELIFQWEKKEIGFYIFHNQDANNQILNTDNIGWMISVNLLNAATNQDCYNLQYEYGLNSGIIFKEKCGLRVGTISLDDIDKYIDVNTGVIKVEILLWQSQNNIDNDIPILHDINIIPYPFDTLYPCGSIVDLWKLSHYFLNDEYMNMLE